MRYSVSLAGRTVEVELGGEEVVVAGRRVRAELSAVPGGPVRHLLVDGRSIAVAARPGAARGEWAVLVGGRWYDVEVVDERTRAIRELTAAAAPSQGPKPVRAPMPGLVVRVDVEAGQAVRPGQGIVIIEAMKMENELKAEAAGVVARVLVDAGQAVEKGAVLVEFESVAEAV